jgi:hypothetical protein
LDIFKATKKINAIFLAAIIFAGTIVTLIPSFMLEAQAKPYFGVDKDRKQVSVSSLKCNNINVNVNGLELDVFPNFLGGSEGLVAEAVEPNTDASFFAGNGPNGGSEINDFRFICINNNNNTIIGAEEEEEPIDPCVECFTDNLDIQEQERLLTALNAIINPPPFTSIEDLCEEIADVIEGGNQETLQEVSNDLAQAFFNAGLADDFETVFDCLNEVFNNALPQPQH